MPPHFLKKIFEKQVRAGSRMIVPRSETLRPVTTFDGEFLKSLSFFITLSHRMTFLTTNINDSNRRILNYCFTVRSRSPSAIIVDLVPYSIVPASRPMPHCDL